MLKQINKKNIMSVNTEPIYITKSIVYNIVGKDDKTEKIEKQKTESVVDISENSENYTWIKSNNVFISANNNVLTLNVLNHLIGAKKVEEKSVPKKTSKSKNDKLKEDKQDEELKKYKGFYLSIVDLSEEFEIKKSIIEAWAKSMDKYTPACKIVENGNWMHISALPAFLTTFVEKYREIFAEAFNRIILEQKLDVDELKIITPTHKVQSLELKDKELIVKKKEKVIATGQDAYKIILVSIHDDEDKKYIAIDTTTANNIDKFEKTKSKDGKYKTIRIETNSDKVATNMIKEYLINVKELKPSGEVGGKKRIGSNILFYEDNELPSENEIKEIFNEFNENYIKEHLTSKSKINKQKQDKDVKLNAPKSKKSVKEDKEDKEDKKEQSKPNNKTTASKKKPVIEEESKQQPVKQDSSEEDEEFTW